MHRRDRRNRRSRPAGDVTVTKDADTGYLSTGTPEDASGSRAPTLRVLTGRVALVGAVLVTVFVALAGFAGYQWGWAAALVGGNAEPARGRPDPVHDRQPRLGRRCHVPGGGRHRRGEEERQGSR